jgi:flagellar biosynthesis/type III secretory pathway M-ring protein FliF/YscJ
MSDREQACFAERSVRMKKMAFSLILIAVIIGLSSFNNPSEQPADYVTFASAEHLNAELREVLLKRLGGNNIPFQIDGAGNVKIPENKVTDAVMCCS